MLWFILGLILGFALACFGMVLKIVGKLKYTIDDGELYFFMQLNTNNPGSLLAQKYVVLEVDSNPAHK